MALPHLLIGIKQRAAENLFFALDGALRGWLRFWGACDHAFAHNGGNRSCPTMDAHSDIFSRRRASPVSFILISGPAGFGLGSAPVVVRFVCLVINFASPPNVNFREITECAAISVSSERLSSMPGGVVSPWTRLGELSSLLAPHLCGRCFRSGCGGEAAAESRRRAAVVGGSITLFIVLAAGMSALIHERGAAYGLPRQPFHSWA